MARCCKRNQIIRAVLVVLAVSTSMHIATKYWLLPDLERAEFEEFKARHDLTQSNVSRDIAAANRVINDWGNWDTLWDFAHGAYPDFLKENSPPDDLRVLGLAAYAVYSRAGYKAGFVADGESASLLDSVRFYADKISREGGWIVVNQVGYFMIGGNIVAPNRQGSSGRLFVIKKITHPGLEFGEKAPQGLKKNGPHCSKCVDSKYGVLSFTENVKAPDGSIAGGMTYHASRKMFYYARRAIIGSLLSGLALLIFFASIAIRARFRREDDFFERERKLQRFTELGLMLPGIIHEIKNPLTIASGYCGMVQDGKRAGAVKIINDSLKRIDVILNGTRSYCRADKEWSVRNLNSVAKDISVVVPYLLKFQAKLQTSIWPEDLLYLGSEEALHQVVSNLVTNARDALEGRDNGIISLKTYPDGDDVVVEVSDNGPGVPKELREKVFQRDFTTKPVGKGSGLGLSIVRRLVEDMNGDVTIGDSDLGGAKFLVKVPRGRKIEASDS